MASTYSPTKCSTIGNTKLNFSVRNGKRCYLCFIDTTGTKILKTKILWKLMDKVIVNIGNKTYNCQLAKTEEEHRKGLMDVEYLASNEERFNPLYIQNPPPYYM